MGLISDIFHGPNEHRKLLIKKLKSKGKKVTSKGEEAAVYDVEKNKSNKYASVNRHLINKLKG
tara:strand:+ start:574 stop:762 length:189 start_codon:yes stop_codon:yes gene_type:complete